MSNEFQIVFHNIEQSDAITDAVQKKIDKLRRYCGDIIGGRVVLDCPHNNHHKGKVYSVALELQTPNKPVMVTQDQHDNHAHEDLYVAIRDAFNAAERQLKSVDKKHRKAAAHKNPDAVAEDMAVDEDLDDEPEYQSAYG
jgi:ribosomal subunit interface protein